MRMETLMSGGTGGDRGVGIDSEADFHDALHEILVAATANGVDVRGGWPIRTDGGDTPDWDLEIVELKERE